MSRELSRAMIFLLGFLVLLAGCGSDKMGPKDVSLQQLQSLGISLSVTTDAAAYPVGQPAILNLNVTNNSSTTRVVQLGTTSPNAFPPLRFVVAVASSGLATFLGDVTSTPSFTVAPGQTVTIGTFTWNQTTTGGRAVSPGTFNVYALVGEIFVDGQAIFNPYGTIYVPGPNIRVTAVAPG